MKTNRVLLSLLLSIGLIPRTWSGGVTTYSAEPPIAAAIHASTTSVEPGGTVVFTATDGGVGAAYDRDTEFLDGNFNGYINDTISIAWQATNSSGTPAGTPTSGSGSTFTWTAPTAPPTTTTVYTVTMTVTDSHSFGSASDDQDISGTAAKKFKVDVRYTLQCGLFKAGVLNAQDAFSATNLPDAYAKQYSLDVPTAQDADISIDTYRTGGTIDPYTALIEGSDPRKIVAWQGPVTIGGVRHSTINYRTKANTAYTLEVTTTEPNQIGSFIVTMSGCTPVEPNAAIPVANETVNGNDEGLLTGINVSRITDISPGDYRTTLVGILNTSSVTYTDCSSSQHTVVPSGIVYLQSSNPRVVQVDDVADSINSFHLHVQWPTTPTTVTITASHYSHAYGTYLDDDLVCHEYRMLEGPGTATLTLTLTPDGITANEIYLDNSIFEPSNRRQILIGSINAGTSYTLYRDGGILASGIVPQTTSYTDDIAIIDGTKHVYYRLTGDTGYAELTNVRVVPITVNAVENQTVDTRVDPRYASPPLLNYTFKQRIYNGGLFVGATKQETDYTVKDASGTSRSFLKFLLPGTIIGGTWQAGSVNAYCTTYRKSSSGATSADVACIPISNDGWDQEWLQWSRSLTFLPGGFNPANALAYQKVTIPFDHVDRWYSWNLKDRFSALGVSDRLLSVVLASPAEPPSAEPNAWLYFAKKEYQIGAYKPYALCLYKW
jgi:hypothetical protein